MWKQRLLVIATLGAFLTFKLFAQEFSGNPIFTNFRTADASPLVGEDGRLWVYTSGDHPTATDYSQMDHYKCYSTADMVNWSYHGVILSSSDLSWKRPEGGYMFAPDIAYKNGKYYLYFPHNIGKGKGFGWRIGVAISDQPDAPFVDIGEPIKGPEDNPTGMRAYDPHCFVDDDGKAYLYWGFGDPPTSYVYCAALKENMTELAEEPRRVDIGAANFREAPFVHKRAGKYYFTYKNWPENSAAWHAIGDSPYGPFVNHGMFAESRHAPAHPGIIEFKGKWYYFWQRGDYTMDGIKGSHCRRVICVDEMHYNNDGTIKEVQLTERGVEINTN